MILKTNEKTDTIASFQPTDSALFFNSIDLTPWLNLKDSGTYNENKLKEGLWIEFPIDTSNVKIVKNLKANKIFEPEIVKWKGNYSSGTREGVWIIYSASLREKPYFWSKTRTTEYKNGVKNGVEVYFEPFSENILMKVIYLNGEPIEMKK